MVVYVRDGEVMISGPKYGFLEWMRKLQRKIEINDLRGAKRPSQGIEQEIQAKEEIQAKGKAAPRVTPADIEEAIASEHYFTAADGVVGAYRNGDDIHPVGGSIGQHTTEALGLLTFCVLVLRNGFTVTGESACVSPENFNADIGRRIARENAMAKIWPLLGYELKTRLHQKSAA